MSDYLKIMSRKRTWTPVAVDKGQVIDGAEDTLKRCLALRTLELPVKGNAPTRSGERTPLMIRASSPPFVLTRPMRTSMILLSITLWMLTALMSELS